MSGRATVSATSRYAILGCGSVGHAVAEELTDRGQDVLILDRDENRVEALRDQDLNAQTADISEPSVAETVADRDILLVLSSNVEANRAAVEHVREHGDGQFVVVRASDPVSSEELTDLGADVVINPSSVIADAALRALESGELEYRASELVDVIHSGESLAILVHENPDPDTIAAGVALQAIADHLGVEADILYRGDLGRQESRAFINLLGIELTAEDETDPEEYDVHAFVDHVDTEGKVSGPIDIYVGNHETDEDIEVRFADVRPSVSATSTVLTKYIQEFDFNVDEVVATALLYGIRAATLDFRRDTTPADLTAAAYLYSFADHDALEQVESPNMSPETLDVLAEAIRNREVEGSHLVSNAGFINDREAISQAAQQLLNLEGVTTTAVFGIVEDTIHLAARSKDIRLDIGDILAEAFDDIGESAGHSTRASTEIPLGIFTGLAETDDNRSQLSELAEEAVTRKLFDALGVESESES